MYLAALGLTCDMQGPVLNAACGIQFPDQGQTQAACSESVGS